MIDSDLDEAIVGIREDYVDGRWYFERDPAVAD